MIKKTQESARGKRYSSTERVNILTFVDKYNARNGRGGAAAASRKYDISQLTIGNWLRAAGSPSPKRKKSNVDIDKTLIRLSELHKLMANTEEELDKQRKEYAELKMAL
ncbi:MAG: hypothetical protein ACJAR1_001377 [Rubritalea sp.]|jgi:hypothetical protein|tara:strand:+ start:14313 stop:14639 length:327 start_codon:yes stop_codon:yes gene_type:complete